MAREWETPLQLCCLLWAQPGQEAALTDYEDRVLAFLPDHDGAVLQRAIGDCAEGQPTEVQLYRFANQAAFAQYRRDPRRLELTAERDRVIARTELFPVVICSAADP